MDISPQYNKYKIDLEEAEVVSVNYKTGQVSVGLIHKGTQFTKTFDSPHPNFSRLSERLTNHVFNVMRFEEGARQDVEWRGVKWQNRDSDGESVTLTYTYRSEDEISVGQCTPKIILDTTDYLRVGDLREVLADLEIEAKEAWGGKSAQMSLDLPVGEMRKAIEVPFVEQREADADEFEQQDNTDNDQDDLKVNVNGGSIPAFTDEGKPAVIITDEADDSFDQSGKPAPEKEKKGKKDKAETPPKGSMKVVSNSPDEEAAA